MKIKEYKSFLIKFLIFFCLLILVDRITGWGFDNVRKYSMKVNPSFKTLKVNYAIEKMDSEIIIIGASTAAMHYIPQQMSDSLGLSVYNCGLAGCYMLFQCCLINTILDRYHPKLIIWDIGYQSLACKYDEYEHIDYLYPYYSNSYCRDYINSFDKNQSFRMISKMYQNNSDYDKYMRALLDKKTFDNGFIPLNNDGTHPVELVHDRLFDEIDTYKVDVFRKTLLRISNSGIDLFFVSSPQFHDGKAVDSKSARLLLDIINNFNIPLLRYENSIQDPILFRDAEHLNYDGAKRFMNEFIPHLKKYVHINEINQ